MAIIVVCQCGQRLSARDELQGKRIKCPKCGSTLTIRPAPVAAPGETPHAAPTVPPVAKAISPAAPAMPDAEFPWSDASGPVAAMPAHGTSKISPAASDPRGWIVVDAGLAISFWSLLVGGGAFAVIAVVGLAAMSGPDFLPRLLSGGGGGFLGILLIWSALAWLGSYVALATGWGVCWAVPRKTNTRPMIHAAIGAVAASLGIILFMQLVSLAMEPTPPNLAPRSVSQPHTPAEWQKWQADVERASKEAELAAKQAQANAKTMAIVSKVFLWLSIMASLASCVAFGLFLGKLGEYLGETRLNLWALYFCILQGAFALWLTANVFVIEANSLAYVRLCMMLTLAFILATYGGLIYLAHNTRRLVAKQARALTL